MAKKEQKRNYQNGTVSGIDSPTSVANPMLAHYMEKFYYSARGHLVNKYHVGFWGDYVDEALRIMDRNAYADKYNITDTKTFKDTGDLFYKEAFNDWATLFYDPQTRVLNMYWAAKSVKIGESKAKMQDTAGIDTTKGMKYPLIRGDQGPQQLTITIVDDPYMMWYQFFNALYNAQYSPLVLKARSTWHKINVGIDLYCEGTTYARSKNGDLATDKTPFITDITLAQMYEYNSAVLIGAPTMDMGFEKRDPYTFTVTFKYPNAFQGSFKNHLRYLRDNTCDGTDVYAVDKKNMQLRRRFFEDDYGTLKKLGDTYETFHEKEYYRDYGQRFFATKNS